MKKIFTLTVLAILFSSFQASSASLPIQCDDSVFVYTAGKQIIQKVEAITEHGQYMLSDGGLYSRKDIQALIPTFKNINKRDLVIFVIEGPQLRFVIQRVVAITENGLFLLTDYRTFSRQDLYASVSTREGISIKDKVFIRNADGRRLASARVEAIFESGHYLLGNGKLYLRSDLLVVSCKSCN